VIPCGHSGGHWGHLLARPHAPGRRAIHTRPPPQAEAVLPHAPGLRPAALPAPAEARRAQARARILLLPPASPPGATRLCVVPRPWLTSFFLLPSQRPPPCSSFGRTSPSSWGHSCRPPRAWRGPSCDTMVPSSAPKNKSFRGRQLSSAEYRRKRLAPWVVLLPCDLPGARRDVPEALVSPYRSGSYLGPWRHPADRPLHDGSGPAPPQREAPRPWSGRHSSRSESDQKWSGRRARFCHTVASCA